jgi:ferredoxin
MSSRVDPDLLFDLKQFGAEGAVNIEACFNCGNCTAICPLTSDDHPFPRNTIRLMQLGLRDQLLENADPWLCYYCGECTATCPRQAEPAEAQMAIRRWLTSEYDWTGLARKFYTSAAWEIGSIVVVVLAVVLGFVIFHGEIVTDHVALNTFAPVHTIHLLDRIMAVVLLFFLLTNALRMWYFTMWRGHRIAIPWKLYLTEAGQLPLHFLTQKRFRECDEKQPWLIHALLVSGYVLMLVTVIVFLQWFQTDALDPWWHLRTWMGYYAATVIMLGAGWALRGRMRKARQLHRFSHLSDWIFPILLFVGAFTGGLTHTLRYLGFPMATYVTYVIHLAILVPMLTLEVPFGKWSHLAYRPLAVYFDAVTMKAKQLALAEDSAETDLSPALH